MSARTSRVMGAAGYLMAFAYSLIVIGFPTGYELSRTMTHIQLFVLGFLVALLIRSFWAVIYVPAIIVFTPLVLGIVTGRITTLQEGLATAFRFEAFLFGAPFAGVFLGTLLPRMIRRVVRSVKEESPHVSPAGEPNPNGRDTSET